jgi:formamidopyrimidine-DNA glycosylase
VPELPEVETIVRSLNNPLDLPFTQLNQLSSRPGIVGRVVSEGKIYWARSLVTPTPEEFCALMVGQRVRAVTRRGKFLVFQLDSHFLLIHLRMSGDILILPAGQTRDIKHDRAELCFQDGDRMVFNDPRKFGRMWLVKDPEEVTSALGTEPLSELLTVDVLYRKLNSTARQIKPLLLDQTFLAGLGNIYTDEALFLAKIHPQTKANQLSEPEAASLLNAIRMVLNEGIRRNGASIDWVYRGGEFQNYFQVYQRTGEKCLSCGTLISRITVGQRGTHYCPSCQRLAL